MISLAIEISLNNLSLLLVNEESLRFKTNIFSAHAISPRSV